MKSRGRRKVKEGIVSSARMDKSIVVLCERLIKHPRLGKYIRQRTKHVAHDEENRAREGDQVEIMEARPLSKTKHWRLVKVLSSGAELPQVSGSPDDTDAD